MAELEAFGRTAEAAAENPGGHVTAGRDAPEIASNYCPRCSVRLASRSCKLICPACGYYMSCSDFY